MSVNPRINISTINSIETKTACFDGARYYDPSLQRFLGEDPIGFSSGDFNFYRYVLGDPVNFVDADGESAARFFVAIIIVAFKVWVGAPTGRFPVKPHPSPMSKPWKKKGKKDSNTTCPK